MCLIVFGWKAHPDYPLIFAANRDEFYNRPTATAHWWEDKPEIFGGRDLQAGGTWMGITKKGRIAAVTNYRKFPITETFETSRGNLVTDFLATDIGPESYLKWLKSNGDRFEGFNILFGDSDQLFYFGNHSKQSGAVTPGIHGLSNHLLDTPWPKVVKAKKKFEKQLSINPDNKEEFINILLDKELASAASLPDTGIGIEKEKALSSMFIEMDGYGTRASYVTIISNDGVVNFLEKSHLPAEITEEKFSIRK